MKKESSFQKNLISELKDKFPGCVVIKNDPTYIQGFPDLLVLYKKKWAALECKRGESESCRPNQDYYVGLLNEMSFASFIFPENKMEVIDGLQQTFRNKRSSRFP